MSFLHIKKNYFVDRQQKGASLKNNLCIFTKDIHITSPFPHCSLAHATLRRWHSPEKSYAKSRPQDCAD
jgi:hypothetical protein